MEKLENELNNITDAIDISLNEDNESKTTERINDMFSFLGDEDVPVSEIVENRDSIGVGISLKDLEDIAAYWRGESERPIIVSKITSNNFRKLKDISSVNAMYLMGKIPAYMGYLGLIEDELYKPERLMNMDTKDLLNSMDKITKVIGTINQNTTQILASVGSEDSEPNKLSDLITSLSNEKYARLREMLKLEDGDSVLDAVIKIIKERDINPESYTRLCEFLSISK